MKLSIIIPIYNKWSFTKSCLEVFKTLPSDIEIIIVDNGSIDETQSAIEQYNVKYIKNDSNLGFGQACNIGYHQSIGDYVMFLNNDIMFKTKDNSWLYSYIGKIKDNELVGPSGGFVDPKNDFSFCYETKDNSKPINYVSGWCISAKRNTWEKLSGTIGPFDSKTFFLYFEDVDLSFRASRLGMKLVLAEVPLEHIGKQSSKQGEIYPRYLRAKKNFVNKWK